MVVIFVSERLRSCVVTANLVEGTRSFNSYVRDLRIKLAHLNQDLIGKNCRGMIINNEFGASCRVTCFKIDLIMCIYINILHFN